MIRSKIVVGLILALGLAVGCEKDKAPAPTSKPAPKITKAMDANNAKGADDAKAIEDAKVKAAADTKAIEDAKTAEAAKVKADAAKAAEAAGKEATSQLENIQSQITGGKLADAEKLLKALEDKLGTFAPDIQEKVKALRTALTAKKAADALKIPGVPT